MTALDGGRLMALHGLGASKALAIAAGYRAEQIFWLAARRLRQHGGGAGA